MKNNIRISLLVSALALLAQAPICADIHDRIEYKLNRVLRDVEIINNEIASECTTIVPKDFEDENGVLSQTYVIAAPGKYCLGANIDFEPLDEFTPAIVILSDAVSLNLNGFTLRQAEGNSTANAYGVQIGQGYFYDDPDAVLKNITISNGNITNFSAIGVFCYNGSFDGGASELAFQDLHLFDLNILDCGSSPSFDSASGINLDSVADFILYDLDFPVAYRNISIENCNVNRCKGNIGLVVYTADNVVVNNTQVNNLTTEFAIIGLSSAYYISARNLQMNNCQGNNTRNIDTDIRSHSVFGLIVVAGNNLALKNCQFNDIFGENSVQVYGANLPNLQNALIENCQFNNARGGINASIMSGVRIGAAQIFQQTQGNGIKFVECQFNGTTVDASAPISVPAYFSINCGILFQTVRNVIFENCQACNIHTENPNYHSFGYFVATDLQNLLPDFGNGQNITFKNCVASDISTAGKDAVGIFTGSLDLDRSGIQGRNINVVVDDCVVERIKSDSSDYLVAGIAQGLYPAEGLVRFQYPQNANFLVRNCRISDVRAGEGNPLSAGIVAESVQRPVIIGNSVSDCDRGILLTGTDDIIPNRFQLAETLDDALAFPPVFIDLNTIPSAAPAQNFNNITQANSISIAPSAGSISTSRDFISAPIDLNLLGWQVGDQILYDANGGSDISDLVSTTTYYLIVYVPGFSENGVIEQNEVDNCSVSGYQDDAPVTSSAWVDNLAFNDGTPASAAANYAITWAGVAPVDAGTLAAYPVGGNKYYNLSLIP